MFEHQQGVQGNTTNYCLRIGTPVHSITRHASCVKCIMYCFYNSQWGGLYTKSLGQEWAKTDGLDIHQVVTHLTRMRAAMHISLTRLAPHCISISISLSLYIYILCFDLCGLVAPYPSVLCLLSVELIFKKQPEASLCDAASHNIQLRMLKTEPATITGRKVCSTCNQLWPDIGPPIHSQIMLLPRLCTDGVWTQWWAQVQTMCLGVALNIWRTEFKTASDSCSIMTSNLVWYMYLYTYIYTHMNRQSWRINPRCSQ